MKVTRLYKYSLKPMILWIIFVPVYVLYSLFIDSNPVQKYMQHDAHNWFTIIFLLICAAIGMFFVATVIISLINYVYQIILAKNLVDQYKKVKILSYIPIVNWFAWIPIRKEYLNIKNNTNISDSHLFLNNNELINN